ncbi:hypothetical protein Lfu02_35580 [Longispora fulva]|nr:hypothetical protein Lfu02_35580 [Longispora fulva]
MARAGRGDPGHGRERANARATASAHRRLPNREPEATRAGPAHGRQPRPRGGTRAPDYVVYVTVTGAWSDQRPS